MFRDSLIEYCSPTLASLKLGSLFRYKYEDLNEFLYTLEYEQQWLKLKGISIEIVSIKDDSILIYLFRDSLLSETLQNREVQEFLSAYGYKKFNVEGSIETLKDNFKKSMCPHEVGIFLGYPLNDVVGFIENCGKNCKCCGYWKVYDNETEALKTFKKFSKCKDVYKRLFSEGFSIKRLTVAM
jgi:hypothetical protein